MQAGSSRIETGSHVNVTGLNLILGIALGQQTELGKLLVGPFFEAGFGSYNTCNSFDNAASVNGEGRTNFLGAGILARFDFADMALGHPWLEGSFRIGHAFNSYNNDDLKDGADNTADYDTDAPYQSFHVGLGYLFNLTEADRLDVYGKYFWSHLGGSDANVLGDSIEFDDVFSSRLRFGGRYSHDFGPNSDSDKGYSISPYPALDKTFCDYIRYSVFGRLNLTDSVPEFQDLEEAETMLAENMTQYRKKLLKKGKLEQAFEAARKLLQSGKLTLAEIASYCAMTLCQTCVSRTINGLRFFLQSLTKAC